MFGIPFGPEIDVWSLGCILAEVSLHYLSKICQYANYEGYGPSVRNMDSLIAVVTMATSPWHLVHIH